MARLIDADELRVHMLYAMCGTGYQHIALAEIDRMPTVDAVPVVRCKDCKYYQQGRNADEWLWCMMNHHYTDEKKYCAWAERKEE